MKKSRFTEEQIAFALRQAEGGAAAGMSTGRWGAFPSSRSNGGRRSSPGWAWPKCAG